ncbi:MAG: hypothetical protein OEZ14_01270 [Acidimicrobiia bacterium]|nr:hypothetical protein [Acidimicrobiia bacterium]MDH5519138.1 hypothetical protein [Acidimicrobiia bacterium]
MRSVDFVKLWPRRRLSEPTLALAGSSETIVLDEAQLGPDLFPVLRVLVDEDDDPGGSWCWVVHRPISSGWGPRALPGGSRLFNSAVSRWVM